MFRGNFYGADLEGSPFQQVKATKQVSVFVFIGIEGASAYSRYAKERSYVGVATIAGFIGVTGLIAVIHVLQNPPTDWTGEHGFISAEVFKRHLPPPYADHEYFICGPTVMMDVIEEALGEMNVPLSKYHSERYSFV